MTLNDPLRFEEIALMPDSMIKDFLKSTEVLNKAPDIAEKFKFKELNSQEEYRALVNQLKKSNRLREFEAAYYFHHISEMYLRGVFINPIPLVKKLNDLEPSLWFHSQFIGNHRYLLNDTENSRKFSSFDVYQRLCERRGREDNFFSIIGYNVTTIKNDGKKVIIITRVMDKIDSEAYFINRIVNDFDLTNYSVLRIKNHLCADYVIKKFYLTQLCKYLNFKK